jgi:hypothetical protein
VIPKSIHEDRIRENSQVFVDLQLAPEDETPGLAERQFAYSILGLAIEYKLDKTLWYLADN